MRREIHKPVAMTFNIHASQPFNHCPVPAVGI